MRFGQYVRERLVSLRLSANDLAERLHKSPGNISSILNGRPVNKHGTVAKPPLEEMERWAEVLQLDDTRTKTLKKLAALEHCPEEIQTLVAGYEMAGRDPIDTDAVILAEQVEELQTRLAAAEAANRELRLRMDTVKAAVIDGDAVQRRAASDSESYAGERRELDMTTNPDDYASPPAPTYPRPAPIRGGSDG